MTGEADANAIAAARSEAARQNAPLDVAMPNEPRLNALYGARYVLIRPDQHIAWRGDTLDDIAAVLTMARGGFKNDNEQASAQSGRRQNA